MIDWTKIKAGDYVILGTKYHKRGQRLCLVTRIGKIYGTKRYSVYYTVKMLLPSKKTVDNYGTTRESFHQKTFLGSLPPQDELVAWFI